MHVMEESRTDQRFRAMDKRFDRLEAALAASTAELRKEIKDSNAELRNELKDSNAELSARMDALRTLLQIGGGLIGTMIVVFGSARF